METLQTLYPYLSKGDLKKRFNEGVRILLKVKRFSNKIAAAKHILKGIENGDREMLNFFSQYKREKAPLFSLLKEAKSLQASLPQNSKLTINL